MRNMSMNVVAPVVTQILQQIDQLPNAKEIKHLLWLKLGMQQDTKRFEGAVYPKTVRDPNQVHDFTGEK